MHRLRRQEAVLTGKPRRRTRLLTVLFGTLAAVGLLGLAASFALELWCELPAFTALAVCGTLGYLEERRSDS